MSINDIRILKSKIIRFVGKDFFIDTIILLLLIIVFCIYFFVNYPITQLNIMSTSFDELIPRVPFFSIIYIFFIPWIWLIIFYTYYKGANFRQFAYSLMMINLSAFCVYSLFQTHMSRDPVLDNDIFSNILKLVYEFDQPYNGFPSLHCALSVSVAEYFLLKKSKWAWLNVLIASLIVVSTLFIKQHFILDAISGVTLGVALTWVVFKMFPLDQTNINDEKIAYN